MNWPPPYNIKKNRLAKRVSLRVSAKKGLSITVPPRFAMKYIPDVLEQHKTWIIKQFEQLTQQVLEEYPTEIKLFGSAIIWSVNYVNCKKRLSLHVRPDQQLMLLGETEDKNRCQQLLRQWVRKEALNILQKELHDLSQRCNLSFSEMKVRDQESRWGSCSHTKCINLSMRLIFLPKNLLHYVLIHELCHTKYLNHSEKFWTLVSKFDPHYLEHRKALRQVQALIPAWL